MSTFHKHHKEHGHRYAHSHRPHHDLSHEELPTVARSKATTCEHKLIHITGTEESTGTVSESRAQLIVHLEEQSQKWVEKFTARVNGGDGGLTMKFCFGRTTALVGSARDDPESAISILEEYGS